jgi:hypothetical protein
MKQFDHLCMYVDKAVKEAERADHLTARPEGKERCNCMSPRGCGTKILKRGGDRRRIDEWLGDRRRGTEREGGTR